MHHTIRNVRHTLVGQVGSRRSGPSKLAPASSRKHGGPPVHASRFANAPYQAAKAAIVLAGRSGCKPVRAPIQMLDLDEEEPPGVRGGNALSEPDMAPHAAPAPKPRNARGEDAGQVS